MMSRLARFLNRPLFGTKVIPHGACVDPSQFPEDEFPVHCSKCGYLLRGLPDGTCPECNTDFRRGRLLVLQYFHAYDAVWSSKHGRITLWWTLSNLAYFAGLFLTGYLIEHRSEALLRAGDARGSYLWFEYGQKVADVSFLGFALINIAGGILAIVVAPNRPPRSKYRLVRDALYAQLDRRAL